MKRWYALHCKPNSEYQVVAILQQRGIESYLPEIEVLGASRIQRKKPLFPCYLFCQVDLKRVGLSKIQWIPGLRRIVTFGGQPVPVPADVIDLVRYKLDETQANRDPLEQKHRFKSGDLVRIKQGPFQDMIAIFDRPTSPSERVQVLLGILGGVTRVQVETDNLEEASAPAEISKPKRPRRTRGQGRFIRRSEPGQS
jgi:transcriptional antiterminator RfaH